MSIILGEGLPGTKPGEQQPYRNWKIWWWDDEDKMHIEYTKQKELTDVINFCKMRGFKKYSIFDDKNFHNVCNDGQLTPL